MRQHALKIAIGEAQKKKGKNMNAKWKAILILIIGLVLCLLLADVATTAFVKLICPLTFMNYAEQGESLLNPPGYAGVDENAKLPALLTLRALLDDADFEYKNGFLGLVSCTNMEIRQSNGFQSRNGESDYAEGIFAIVVQNTNGNAKLAEDTIGLVKINDICDEPYIEQLMKLLEETPDALIQLTQYGEKDCLIVPVSLTVYNTQMEELASFSQPLEKAGYELRFAEDVFIYNTYQDGDFLKNGDYSLYELLRLAKSGKRKEDSLMKSNLEAAASRSVENIHEVRYGVGSYTMVDLVVSSDRNYVMSRVLTIRYIMSTLFYASILSLTWVLIWALVIRKKITD